MIPLETFSGTILENISMGRELTDQKYIFAHANNYMSLSELLKHGIHCFYHINDYNVLTS